MRPTGGDSKPAVLAALLAEGMVLVALDARRAGVQVPRALGGEVQLRLNLSRRFGLPVSLDADAVRATLTFGAERFACVLPWAAIFLMVSLVDGQPFLFADDVPPEAVRATLGARTAAGPPPRGPTLRLVPGGQDADRAPAATPPDRRPAGLTLVSS